ncbi:MAG: DNA-binding response OmpR family regulator [Candidatus Azotimanducaceae bacterium]|jgi:DNA-binding response OmpR family regulator
MRVLVIQTNRSILLGIAHLIRAFGFSVETANTIKEAHTKMAPDVLIVDEASAINYGFDDLKCLWQELDLAPDIILTSGGDLTLDQLAHNDRFKLITHPLDADTLEGDLEQIRSRRE